MSGTSKFIAVGENIHCTRIFKVGGKFVKTLDDGSHVIAYTTAGQEQHLPIPDRFSESEEWSKGKKVKHAAVAMWQGIYGDDEEKQAGIAYLQHMVNVQETSGAAFLDLNVDEFSTDVEERVRVIQWVAEVIQQVASIPLSIDSSDLDIMKAGLEACNTSLGKPMVNSVSLERVNAIQLASDAGTAVIAGATGATTMPNSVEERVQNFAQLVPKLTAAGLEYSDIYLDPLVFPASVDSTNGPKVLDTIKELRKIYGADIHFAPGLSNVSYGLPKRRLLNQVFSYLCRENGCDGGIVDPRHINEDILNNLDTSTEAFKLAKAFLVGEDEYGMTYIRAVRKGKI